jgi:O-antigen/teichoic acid export membrane protein
MEVLSALTNCALILATLGLPSAFNKCYHRDCQTSEDRKILTGTALILLALPVLITAAAGFLGARPLTKILFKDPGSSDLVTLAFLSAACYVLAQVPLMVLRAAERSFLYSVVSFWQFLAMMGLNLWMVGHRGMGVKGVLLGSIGSSLAIFLLMLPFTLRNASFRFSLRLARPLLGFGLPMIPVVISSWVMNVSDRWLLQFMADSREVGLYGLGYRFGMMVELLLVTPFQLAWPAFYFREASRPDARDVYAGVLTGYVLVGGWITLAVGLGGEIAVRLMAERSFWAGASVVPIVAMAYFLDGFQYCVAPGVHLGGKTHLLPIVSFVGALSNLALNLLWIPRHGMMGAAWATLVSFAVVAAMTAYLSRRAYGFRFETKRLWKGSALFLGLAIVGLGFHTESLLTLLLVRSTILLVSGVGVGVWVLRELGYHSPGAVGAALSRVWKVV